MVLVNSVNMSDGTESKKTEEAPYEEHYVCLGACGIVAKQERKCNKPGCPRNRNPLTKCKCTDGLHSDIYGLNTPKYKAIETIEESAKS